MSLLSRLAWSLLDCLEVVIGDHAGKRPRRSHRTITRRVYQRPLPVHYHTHYHVSPLKPLRRPL